MRGSCCVLSTRNSAQGLAKQRKATFAAPPTGPNPVWQFDFSEYETTGGGTWQVAGGADYYSTYEFG